jgi:hypothetical protein
MHDAIATSASITCVADAERYYAQKLARSHQVTCRGVRVDVVFEAGGTHLYSEDVEDINSIPQALVVTRNIGGGRREVRQFCLERAVLMDAVLPALSNWTLCTLGMGAPSRAPKLVYGPRLPCGNHVCVVLRPGPRRAWTCLTAYPVREDDYRSKFAGRRVGFP